MDRLHLAEEIAWECDLLYVYSDEYRSVNCHHCGGLLLGRLGAPDFDLHSARGVMMRCRVGQAARAEVLAKHTIMARAKR